MTLRSLVCWIALVIGVPQVAAADGGLAASGIDPALLAPGAHRPRARAGATVIAGRAPRIPAALAGADATKQRMYAALLGAFEQAADKNHVRDDVAAAVAMYLVGAYAAYHGTPISEAAYSAVVAQMRDVLAAAPAFQRASLADKQDLYESTAILGGMMAYAQAQPEGDGAAARAAAKGYLESFLHVAVDAIAIDDRGLVISPAASAPPSAATPAVAAPRRPAGPPIAVAALVWHWWMGWDAVGEGEYLMLPDGTCTTDIPDTLDGFDPAASRVAHPKRWFRWRVRGASYEVDEGGKFQPIAKQVVLAPAGRGERLAGRWERSHAGGGAWTGRTLQLTADGTFALEVAGAWQSSGPSETSPSTSGAFDDDTVRATASAGGVSTSIRSRNAHGAGDRSGTYALDGYTLELRFANGTVERHLFGMSKDRSLLLFRGNILTGKK
jgi:hypothetical protein